MKRSDKLGKEFIYKLRDENFRNFKNQLNKAQETTLEEYQNRTKNPNIDPELQKTRDSKMEFLIGLNSEQSVQLEKLILSIIDNTNYLMLREAEESQTDNQGIGITFDGIPTSEFSQELLSGTLFGEYFSWLETHSELGKFEH